MRGSLPSVNYPTASGPAQCRYRPTPWHPRGFASRAALVRSGPHPERRQARRLSPGHLQFDLSRPIDGAVPDTVFGESTRAAYLPKYGRIRVIRKVNPRRHADPGARVTSDRLPRPTVDAYGRIFCCKRYRRSRGVGLVGMEVKSQPTVRVQVDPEAWRSRHQTRSGTVLGQAMSDLRRHAHSPRRPTRSIQRSIVPSENYAIGDRLSQVAGPHTRYRTQHRAERNETYVCHVQPDGHHPGRSSASRRKRVEAGPDKAMMPMLRPL